MSTALSTYEELVQATIKKHPDVPEKRIRDKVKDFLVFHSGIDRDLLQP